MQQFTFDVLLIGLISVLLIGLIKTPIKVYLMNRGLKDNPNKEKIFKAITITLSFIFCFAGACVYYGVFKKLNPFADTTVLFYTIGVVGASQTIYLVLKTYGRDGIVSIIKTIIQNKNKTTDITKLPKEWTDTELLSDKIQAEIQALYEGAPVTKEDIKNILDHIQ